MSSHILLRGGTLLIHDEDNHVIPTKADILVKDDRIHRIADVIGPPESAIVIDCTDTILAPGFINTHMHLWQSQQKGIHSDQNLLDYFHSGNMASSLYSPDDVFWGVLAGALEVLDAGTTTVVDHAHMNYSPEHSKEAIRATVASGIRSIFCYSVHPRVATWKPELTMESELLPDWVMSTYRELSSMQPFGSNGRVNLGFAVDTMFAPPQILKDIFTEARALGAHLITSHATQSMLKDIPSTVTVMVENGLLGPDVLLSHANHTSSEELFHLHAHGAHLSSTPISEMQMGHGDPVCLHVGFFDISSIGVDSNGICTCYMPTQMQTVLQSTRALNAAEKKGQLGPATGPTVEEVYSLGTILGAKAIGMQEEIGSLKVGKKADIVVFDGKSPGMISVAERNPVAAVVLHSSLADIRTVIVDGVVRKDGYSLSKIVIPTDITPLRSQDTDAEEQSVWWEGVARELERSRRHLDIKRKQMVDGNTARRMLIRYFSKAMGLTLGSN